MTARICGISLASLCGINVRESVTEPLQMRQEAVGGQ